MKQYIIFCIAFVFIQATDSVYGSMRSDLDSQEKQTIYTLKVDVKIEKIYGSTNPYFIKKDNKNNMLLSLPNYDYFCISNLTDRKTTLAEGKYSLYKHLKNNCLGKLHLDENKYSILLTLGIMLFDGSKDVSLPDNYDMTAVIPEPGAVLLSAFGLGIVGMLRRHKTL